MSLETIDPEPGSGCECCAKHRKARDYWTGVLVRLAAKQSDEHARLLRALVDEINLSWDRFFNE